MFNTLPNLLRKLFHLVIPVCWQYFQLWYVTVSKLYYHKKHLKHLTTNVLPETNKADFGSANILVSKGTFSSRVIHYVKEQCKLETMYKELMELDNIS